MRTVTPCLILCPLALLLSGALDAQEAPEAPSQIVEATLFSTLARVTREVAVPEASGVHTLRVGPLPASLLEAGVQAEGEAHHRVLSVQVERRSGGDQATPAFRELEARIVELRGERDRVDRRHAAAVARRARFDGLEIAAPPRRDGETDPVPIDTESWQRFIDLVAEGMVRAGNEMAELSLVLETRNRELAQLEGELQIIATPGRRESATVILQVQNLSGESGVVRVTYEVPLALWYPEYSVRIDPAARRLEISCYGVVHQRTGEDWPEVQVRLSTSIPEQGAEIPELASLRIRRERFEELVRWEADAEHERGVFFETAMTKRPAAKADTTLTDLSKEAIGGVRGFGEVVRLNQFERPDAPHRGKTASPFSGIPPGCVLPADSSRGFLRTFTSARPESVPTDGAPHRLLISRIELPFLEERTAVPELAERVYRRLRATLPGDDPILAGIAAVFLDGAYLGQSRLPTTAPAEQILLDLGVDERVTVTRRQEDREEQIGVFSKARRYDTVVTIELRNLHSAAQTIDLRERMPFTEHEKIKIVLDRGDTQPAPDDWNENSGLLGWTLTVPPGETRTVTLRYHIDAPRGLQLTRTRAPERLEEENR